MHTHSDFPDDLGDLERRLSAWQPAPEGLDADAMLFAAGRAAGRVRLVWPALTGFLAVLTLAFGVWAMTERAERLALDRHLREPSPAPPAPVSSPAVPSEPLTADDWLTARRALEEGLEAWPPQAIETSVSPGPLSTVPVLMVGQRDALLDP